MFYAAAAPRVAVAKCPARLPIRFIEALEHNQQIPSCCRHPENHEISAWFSNEEERTKGTPDIYVLHCPCGRNHYRAMYGEGPRPVWEIR